MAPERREERRIPMTTREKEWSGPDDLVGLQKNSILFKLPRELRDHIWADEPFTLPPFDRQTNHTPDYEILPVDNRDRIEPDVIDYESWLAMVPPTGPVVISRLDLAILRTCRAIYREARFLPCTLKTLRIATPYTSFELNSDIDIIWWQLRIREDGGVTKNALSRIKKVFLMSQVLGLDFFHVVYRGYLYTANRRRPLERGAAPDVPFSAPPSAWTHLGLFSHITLLQMAIPRMHWKDWHDNAALSVNPFVEGMHDRWPWGSAPVEYTEFVNSEIGDSLKAMESGRRTLRAQPNSLASALALMPCLKTFKKFLVFVDDIPWPLVGGIDSEDEARLWTLFHPVLDNQSLDCVNLEDLGPEEETVWGNRLKRGWLVANEAEVERWSWRGTKEYFSRRCPACDSDDYRMRNDCAYCVVRKGLIDQGLGPRLCACEVTWRRELDSEFNYSPEEKLEKEEAAPPENEIPSWAETDAAEVEWRGNPDSFIKHVFK
ncbi:hypothetical protein QBC36DRAFT_304331 [Triangularia setosa]|uniref:Uncharacterized protein n=1 Tax=Triangularia setosa TaxID=2587417 RepID=A0AAN6VZF1_9PEZI|nr:hypothetical protein QBC36DRAFT_304331 [Podospora setosa]